MTEKELLLYEDLLESSEKLSLHSIKLRKLAETIGTSKSEESTKASANTASAPFIHCIIHCVHCVHLEQKTLNCKLEECVNKQRT